MATIPKFIAADEYFAYYPQHQQLFYELRHIIMQCCPGVREVMRWNMPFYDYLGMMCYLAVRKTGEAELAFNEGPQMEPRPGVLQAFGRNTISSLVFNSLADLDEDLVRECVCEAMVINEEIKARKRRRLISPKLA